MQHRESPTPGVPSPRLSPDQPCLFALAQPCCLLGDRFLGISKYISVHRPSLAPSVCHDIAAKHAGNFLTFTWIQDLNRRAGLQSDMVQSWTNTSTHQAKSLYKGNILYVEEQPHSCGAELLA